MHDLIQYGYYRGVPQRLAYCRLSPFLSLQVRVCYTQRPKASHATCV